MLELKTHPHRRFNPLKREWGAGLSASDATSLAGTWKAIAATLPPLKAGRHFHNIVDTELSVIHSRPVRSMCNSAVPSNKSRRRAAGVVTGLRYAVMLLVTFFPFFPLSVALAQQTRNGDADNFRSLQEAVEAIREGRLQQAEAALNAVLAVSPRDSDALNLLGVVRATQQRAADAEYLFRRSLAASPTHVGAYVNLGELYITEKKPQQALPILLTAHKLAPNRPDVNLSLATLYEDMNQYELALKHLRLIPVSAADAAYYQLLLTSLLKLNRLEEARKLSLEIKGNLADDSEGQAMVAMLLAGGGLNSEALDLLEAARARAPESFPVLYALGVINASAKRYERAEEYLNGALRAKPDDVATLRALARVARSTGNFEKSLAQLVQARRIAPESPGVLYEFGVTVLEMGLYLDALPAFEQLHRLYPRESAYLYALALARLRGGERAEAASLLKSYLTTHADDAAGFYLLGAALHGLKQYTEARVALERSLKLKPDADAETLLGMTLYDDGNREAAIETLRRVVRARPEHAAAHAALGTALRDQGNYAEARVVLERAVELNPKDLRANYQLGLVYAKLGDKEAARRMFNRADALRGEERNQEKVVFRLADPPENVRPNSTTPK